MKIKLNSIRMSLLSSRRTHPLAIINLIFLLAGTLHAQWTTQNSNTSQALHSIHFINTQTGYCAGNSGVVLKTTNGGVNWLLLNTSTSMNLNSAYVFNANTVIACGNSGLIIKTTNGGTNWATMTSGVSATLYGISFSNDSNGICCGNGILLWSTNGGVSWLVGQQGFLVTYYGAHMVSSTLGFVGGVNTIFSPLVGKTTNSGANWTFYSFYVQSNEATLRDIRFINSNEGFAVSIVFNGQGGISYTTNGGANWSSQVFTSGLLGIDFPTSNTGYTVGSQGYILKTTDRGATWNPQSGNTFSILWDVSFPDSLNGYVSGDNGLILKTTNGGITGVNPNSNSIPSKYSLYQNFPNPFNPQAIIKFDIPDTRPLLNGVEDRGVFVRLTIFNILGNEIIVLLNEKLSPRTYEITWDASEEPSGIYFCRLQTDVFSDTKKMILLK
jgi:photosystem II stability/assembly factor-like uncharacterized protein